MTAPGLQATTIGVSPPAVVQRREHYRSGDPEPWERPHLEELGGILRAARFGAGLTLRDLGPVAGAAPGLQKVESGRKRTRASRLRPWAEHLGLDAGLLLVRFAAVIAPEREDGRLSWSPTPVVPLRDVPAPPDLAPHERAALGAELWRIRLAAGLSRPALAELLGCTRGHVRDVERAHRRPSPDLLEDWVTATGSERDHAWLRARFPGQLGPRRRRRRGHGAPGLARVPTDGAQAAVEPRRSPQ